jgi:thioredoxin-dependent peroxiredoxin
MAHITRRGTPTETVGDLPAVGTKAPGFTLTGQDLADVTQDEWSGRRLVLNIFPSIDTATASAFRSDFGDVYGVRILDGGTSHEPDYDVAIAAL